MSENPSNTKGLGWAFHELYIFYTRNAYTNAFGYRRIHVVRDIQFDEPNVLNKHKFSKYLGELIWQIVIVGAVPLVSAWAGMDCQSSNIKKESPLMKISKTVKSCR
jgi:hypothetical protein